MANISEEKIDKLKKIATSANEQREKYGLSRIEEAAFDIKYVSKEQYDKLLAQG